MKKLLKILGYSLLAIILFVVGSQFYFYQSYPEYEFQEPKPFHGENIWNPYQDIDTNNWLKANFQLQSRAWGGITNGRKNQNDSVKAIYRKLGYDIAAISDYQKINEFEKDSAYHIQTYEHGYNIHKTHQVCIGSKKVLWRDYFFRQNLSQKQHIIDLLRPDNEIIALAHPDLRDGYMKEDFRYLCNYDMMEVLNGARNSFDHWDAALSAGHFAPILSNDDAHDISKADEVGIRATFINAPANEKNVVIDAMKAGKTYGVDYDLVDENSWTEKLENAQNLPFLKSVRVINDSLFVRFSAPMLRIKFVGQNGKLLKTMVDRPDGFYKIKDSDTYVRIEAVDVDTNLFYLNPVFRIEGDEPIPQRLASIKSQPGVFKPFVGLLVFIALILMYLKIRKRWKRQ